MEATEANWGTGGKLGSLVEGSGYGEIIGAGPLYS